MYRYFLTPLLIILRSGSSATGNNSFNSLVGTGSNKHVVKHCSISLGVMNEAEVLDAVESTFVNCISDIIYFISE